VQLQVLDMLYVLLSPSLSQGEKVSKLRETLRGEQGRRVQTEQDVSSDWNKE